MNSLLKFMFIVLQLCEIVFSQSITQSSYVKIKIGGIFSEKNQDAMAAFTEAANNFNRLRKQTINLEAVTITVDTTDSYRMQKAVCDMISANNDAEGNNVVALFGPNSPETAGLVSSICKKLQIPHFTALWQPIDVDFNRTGSFTRNIFPHPKLYSTALYQIIRGLHWRRIAFVYDSDDSLMRLQQALPLTHERDFTGNLQMQAVRFHRLPDKVDDYKVVLKTLYRSGSNNIVIDSSLENAQKFLNMTHLFKLNTEYTQYFLANYDTSQTMDYTSLFNFESNVTTIRFYPMDDSYEGYTSRDPNSASQFPTTEAAMISDAVYTFATTLSQNETFLSEFRMDPITCDGYANQEPNSNGQTILDSINDMEINGRTGLIHFDQDGLRNTFSLQLIEYTRNSTDGKKFATYGCPSIQDKMQCDPKDKNYNSTDIVDYVPRNDTAGTQASGNLRGRNVKVIMRLNEPFLVLKAGENNTNDRNNKTKYEGFSLDLFNNLSAKAGFTYDIDVREKDYPTGNDDGTGVWDGIIKELINLDADFAISDITITQKRKRVIDFSISFKTLGVSILYRQPEKLTAGMFAFVDPLSPDVWVYIGIGFLFVCIAEWLLAKIADIDWEVPHPCDEDPEELENIWDMHNCIWLTVATFMQQGCDILPKGVPPRLVAVVWWFFGMIIVESYKATLTATMTKVSIIENFRNIEELSKQNEILYGLMARGATEALFKNTNESIYEKMWHTMLANPSVFVKTNEDGVNMVRLLKGKYAFFCETTTIEFNTHRDGDLSQVGDKLDSKEYGLAMPMNSPHRQEINAAILDCKEKGELKEMYERWWTPEFKPNGERYKDNEDEDDEGTKPMGMGAVGGAFIVLSVGIPISLLLGFTEFLWAVRQTSIEFKITPREAFRKELDFNIRVWKLYKPIAPSSEQNSLLDTSDEEKIDD